MKNKLKKILMLYGLFGPYVSATSEEDITLTDEEEKIFIDLENFIKKTDNYSFDLSSGISDIDSEYSEQYLYDLKEVENQEESIDLSIDDRIAEDENKTDEELKLKKTLKKVLVAISNQYYNDSMFGCRIDIINQNLGYLHTLKSILEKEITKNELDLTNKQNDFNSGYSLYKSQAKAYIRSKKDQIANLKEQYAAIEKEISKKKEDYKEQVKQSEADRESKKKRLQDGVRNAKKAKENSKNQILKDIRSKRDEISIIEKSIDKADSDLIKANEKRDVAKQKFDDISSICADDPKNKKLKNKKTKANNVLKAAESHLNNAKTEQKKNVQRQIAIEALNKKAEELSIAYDKFCTDSDKQMLAKEEECRKKIEFIDKVSAVRMEKDKESHEKDINSDYVRLEKTQADLTAVQALINPAVKKDIAQLQDCENPFEKLVMQIQHLRSSLKTLKYANYLNNRDISYYQKLNAMGIKEKELGQAFFASLIEFSNKVTDFNRHKCLIAVYNLNHAEKKYIKYCKKIGLLDEDGFSALEENRNTLKSSMTSVFSEIYGHYYRDRGKISAKNAFYRTNRSSKNELIYNDFDINSLESLLKDGQLRVLNNQQFGNYAYTPIKKFQSKQTYLQKNGMGDLIPIDCYKETIYDESLSVSNLEKFDNSEKFMADYFVKIGSVGNEAQRRIEAQKRIEAQIEAELKANIVKHAGAIMQKSDEAINDYDHVVRDAAALEFKTEETRRLEESTRRQNKENQKSERDTKFLEFELEEEKRKQKRSEQFEIRANKDEDYPINSEDEEYDSYRRQEMMEAGQISHYYILGSLSGFGLYEIYYNGEIDLTISGGIGAEINFNVKQYIEFLVMPSFVFEYKDLILGSVSGGIGLKIDGVSYFGYDVNIKILGNVYKGYYGGFVFSCNDRSKFSFGITWASFVEGKKLSKCLDKLKMSKSIASAAVTYDVI